MRGEISKWGNSLALRIPKALASESRLVEGSVVEIAVEGGRIVVTPAADPDYSLEELLAGVTKSNIHGEVDFGRPVGKEGL
jgi:antitoxin MazE